MGLRWEQILRIIRIPRQAMIVLFSLEFEDDRSCGGLSAAPKQKSLYVATRMRAVTTFLPHGGPNSKIGRSKI